MRVGTIIPISMISSTGPLTKRAFTKGFITFVMFPILVVISWLANKGKLPFLALEKKWDAKSAKWR